MNHSTRSDKENKFILAHQPGDMFCLGRGFYAIINLGFEPLYNNEKFSSESFLREEMGPFLRF